MTRDEKPKLANREYDILVWYSLGAETSMAAHNLGISIDTTKFTQRKLYAELGAVNRAHAIRLGFEHGFLIAGEIRPVRWLPGMGLRHPADCFRAGECQCGAATERARRMREGGKS